MAGRMLSVRGERGIELAEGRMLERFRARGSVLRAGRREKLREGGRLKIRRSVADRRLKSVLILRQSISGGSHNKPPQPRT